MGSERDLHGRHKDGSEFPVEIEFRQVQSGEGRFVFASIVSLAARRTAEENLRASQRELQLLTHRLLETHETERRRVARELHDDVNQRLALLSVEVDMLTKSLPASKTEVSAHLKELSAHIRELSSSVHYLSSITPSKLERLGLW